MRFKHLGRRLRRTAEGALVVSDVFGTVIPSQVITVFCSRARMLTGIGGTQLALPTSFPIDFDQDKRVWFLLRVTIYVAVIVVPVSAVAISRNVIIIIVVVVVVVVTVIRIERRKLATSNWLPNCCTS
jgi:hypothetical protein